MGRNSNLFSILVVLYIIFLVSSVYGADGIAWHPYVLDYQGPEMDEFRSNPNPFLDCRFQVIFVGPGGQVYDVPGFFAGNGEGTGNGNIWRVIFTPDQAGTWSYHTIFEQGENIAAVGTSPQQVGGTISTNTTWSSNSSPYLVTSTITVIDNATLAVSDNVKIILMSGAKLNAARGGKISISGSNIQMIPNAGGSFSIAERDPTAPGFLSKGRLVNDGTYYLKCSGDGTHWIKGGTNSPENFLAYYEFDNTTPSHHFDTHSGIYGAVDYLASKHVNSIYMLLMNIGGDAQDVHPYSGQIDLAGDPLNDNLHFDISKLYQWDALFRHCQEKGIHLHFVLDEGEEANKEELDNAKLGTERKLFYREMIARFGYHNAVTWNLCEEYDYWQLPISPDMAKSWAQYIYDLNPYDHPITIHNYAQYSDCAWKDFWGDTRFGAVSLQYRYTDYAFKVNYFRDQTANCGWKIPVCIDEPIGTSQQADLDGCEPNGLFCGPEYIRKNLIYPVYYSGGQLELFLKEKLSVEDFTKYETAWDYMWYARNSLKNLDISSMQPHHDYVRGQTGSELCFTNGYDYAIYLPQGGSCQLDLSTGTFSRRFYNPRTGEYEGGETLIKGGEPISITSPSGEDWVIILVETGLLSNSMKDTAELL